jgi:hypothetical protein
MINSVSRSCLSYRSCSRLCCAGARLFLSFPRNFHEFDHSKEKKLQELLFLTLSKRSDPERFQICVSCRVACPAAYGSIFGIYVVRPSGKSLLDPEWFILASDFTIQITRLSKKKTKTNHKCQIYCNMNFTCARLFSKLPKKFVRICPLEIKKSFTH